MAERLSYRPTEVQKMIGLGRTKLQELLSTGEIESFSVGRARLVSRAALERWVSQGAQAVTAAEAEPEGVKDATEDSTAVIPGQWEARVQAPGSVNRSAATTSQAPEDSRRGA